MVSGKIVLSILILGATVVAGVAQSAKQESRYSTVNVYLVSTLKGEALTSTERVELIGTDGNTRLLESVGRGVYKISKVPFGEYYLRVDPGSLHAGGSRHFQANEPYVNVILGLPFLLAHGGFPEKHLSGAVDPRLLKKGRT